MNRTRLFNGFKRYVAVDTETTDYHGHGSLDWRTGGLALIQINIDDEKIELLRPTKENLVYIREILEDPDTLSIFHNASFDLKFLANVGIFPSNIFDTQVASELLYAGITLPDDATKTVSKIKKVVDTVDADELFDTKVLQDIVSFKATKQSRFAHNFATVLYRELGVLIPKDMQTSDWSKEPLSQAQIEYAENDVKYSISLASVLAVKLEDAKLSKVAVVEMEAIKVVSFMEFSGIKIDIDEWKSMTKKLKEQLEKEKAALENDFGMMLAEKEENIGLFGYVPVRVNLDSPKQMAEILKLPDVRADTLARLTSQDELLKRFIEYKKLAKLVSTYGDAYLNSVGNDGRLRTQFTQTAVATGRLSSRKPNLQNVPPDVIKSMIRAEKGMIPIQADYSQVELRILAMLSGDDRFIDATLKGDLHSETARQIFGIPEEESVPSELRRKAKCVHPDSIVEVDLNGNGLIPMSMDDIKPETSYYDTFYELSGGVLDVGGKLTNIRNFYVSLPSEIVAVITGSAITLTTPKHKLFEKRSGILKDAELFGLGDQLDLIIPDNIVFEDNEILPVVGGDDYEIFIGLTLEQTEFLAKFFDNPENIPEGFIEDEFSENVVRKLIRPYRVPTFVMKNRRHLEVYIRKVLSKISVKKKNTKVLPLNDDGIIFASQLLHLANILNIHLIVKNIDKKKGVLHLTIKKGMFPKLNTLVLDNIRLSNMYEPLDFETESHTFVVNGALGKNTVNFGIPYGVSASGLVERGYFQDAQDAEKVLKLWKEDAFPVAWKFLQDSGDKAVNVGYTRDSIGRWRRYEVPREPDRYREKREFISNLKLENYGYSSFDVSRFETYDEFMSDDSIPDEVKKIVDELAFDVIKEVHKYASQLSAIRRQGQNMPIQSTSASITKQALVDLYYDAREHGGYFPILTIHDSIFVEADKENAAEIGERIAKIMTKAAEKVLPGMTAPVDVDYGWKVNYTCRECGTNVLKFNYKVEDGKLVEIDPDKVLCEECE